MPLRTADARWNGDLRSGSGKMRLGTGAFEGAYSFASRFEQGQGTNPEELIAAAHAGCFSMATASGLAKAGFKPESISTKATVHLDSVSGGFKITRIDLDMEADVPGIDEPKFLEVAEAAKKGCPVSQALAAVPEIVLTARLRQKTA
jgi:lipoyl-dependent peroxiredoxin